MSGLINETNDIDETETHFKSTYRYNERTGQVVETGLELKPKYMS